MGARGFVPAAIEARDPSPPLPQARTAVLLYCCSGSRGAQAACILTSKGHKVYNLVGGTEAWKSHKLQVK
jgi:rhodanese-related sulfurtransferase